MRTANFMHSFRRKETHAFLRDAVEKRLRMTAEHVMTGRWVEALSVLMLPSNLPKSLKYQMTLIDDMWHYAGDTAADVSFSLLSLMVVNLA